MQPMLNIGPAAIQTATLILIAGFFVGVQVSERTARRHAVPEGFIEAASFYATIAAIIAGRLVYAAQQLDAYRHDPTALLSTLFATIHAPAALIAGCGVFAWLAIRHQITLRPLLDAVAPGLGILLAALELADLVDGVNLGQLTDLPWGIELYGEMRHPVQLYVAVPVIALVLVVLLIRTPRPFAGFDFLLVLGGSALAILISSAWREISPTIFGEFRREAVIAWNALLAVTITGWRWSAQAAPGHDPGAATSPTPKTGA